MWSTENDVILSAATYYFDNKLNNTISLVNPKCCDDPPQFQLAERDIISCNYGQIFVTVNHLLVFHCTFCENRYGTLFHFLQHIARKHLEARGEKSNINTEKETEKKKASFEQELKSKHFKNYKTISNERKNTKSMCENKNPKTIRKKESTSVNLEKIDKKVDELNKQKVFIEPDTVHKDLLLIKNNKTSKQNHRDDKIVKTKNLETPSENKAKEAEYEVHNQSEICTSSLKSPKQKNMDLNARIHSNDKRHSCKLCEKTFTLKSNLTKHLQRHTNIKNFNCDLCEKRFFSRTDAAVHKRIHTGERPYVCFKCGNGFKTTSSLSRHIKRHNNVRTKKCDICEKAFLDSYQLKNHMAGHSSERPFVCSYCSLSFSRQRTLKQHIKLHVNAREYACKLCDKSFNQKPALLSHMNYNHKILES